jgi:alcohol dehydrogenase class IV
VSGDFIWRDAGRTVVCRRNGVAQAAQLLREHGFAPFELLSTPRALAGVAELAEQATAVHEVATGSVPDLAAALLPRLGRWADSPSVSGEIGPSTGGCLVALGGGRVIDVAKAVASVTGARVAAIPTTMSGAEMTAIHRLPEGAESRATGMVRPELVVADPTAMTSQPEAQLRASSMNALAHGADSLYTPFASPVAEMSALRGAELIASSLDEGPGERSPSSLALGSILCGYAIDSALFGLHHVICQTLVRVCGSPHAETNAAILPRAMAFLVDRAPGPLADLAAAIETDPEDIEARLLQLGGAPAGLEAIGADRTKLDKALDSMLLRPELAFVPGPSLSKGDLAELLDAAWSGPENLG